MALAEQAEHMYPRRSPFGCHIAILRQTNVLFGAGAWLLVLTWAYNNFLVPRHTFFALASNGDSGFPLLVVCVALLSSIALPGRVKNVADFAIWTFYLFVVAPSLLFSYVIVKRVDYTWILTLAVAFMACIGVARLRPLCLPRIAGWAPFLLVAGLSWLLLNLYIIWKYGLTLRMISLDSVYDVRLQYRIVADRWTEYAVNWLGNAVNVSVLVLALRRKTWRFLLPLMVMSQLNLFGLTGYKSLLLPLVAGPVVVVLGEERLLRVCRVLSWLVVVFTCFLVFAGSLSPIFMAVADRLLLSQGVLTNIYYEFFSANPKALLAHSILGWMFDYPYLASPDFIIGRLYFHSHTRANANVFADGFANFGTIGVYMAGVLLGGVLWLAKSVTREIDFSVGLIMFMMPVVALSNSPLLTALLTHGVGLALVLLYLYPERHRCSEVDRYARARSSFDVRTSPKRYTNIVS